MIYTIIARFWIYLAIVNSAIAQSLFQNSGLSSDRYLVLFLWDFGLGNRLRSLADWHKIAYFSNRRLILSWKPTIDCNISFSGLFEESNLLSVLPVETFGDANIDEAVQGVIDEAFSFHNYSVILLNENNKDFISLGSGLSDDFIVRENLYKSSINVLITSYTGQLTLRALVFLYSLGRNKLSLVEGVSCQQYLRMSQRLYQSLVPVRAVLDIINKIMEDYFSKHLMIGFLLQYFIIN